MTASRPALLVITGLQREADIAAGKNVGTVCSGGNPRTLADRLATQRPPAGGVLSFGLGGGLAPDVAPGTVVIASHVMASGECFKTDDDWHDRIAAAIRKERAVYRGVIAGHDAVLTTSADKRTMHVETGALVVDMESHVAADYARRHALPFAAIRAVSDPARRSLPEIAAHALRPDGNIDFTKVIDGVLRRPGQIPALVTAGIDSERAFAALRRCRRLLGPLFGLGGAHL
jgi:hopanoid-associated phosphorylase